MTTINEAISLADRDKLVNAIKQELLKLGYSIEVSGDAVFDVRYTVHARVDVEFEGIEITEDSPLKLLQEEDRMQIVVRDIAKRELTLNDVEREVKDFAADCEMIPVDLHHRNVDIWDVEVDDVELDDMILDEESLEAIKKWNARFPK